MFAALSSRERRHRECAELIATAPGPLLFPQTTLAEVAYLVNRGRDRPDLEHRWLLDLASGILIPTCVEPADWLRIAELVWSYRELPLGTVDASIVAIAERLGITTIATLDHRDFSAVRPRHVEAFELLP